MTSSSDNGCKCLVAACRFFGVATSLFLWGVGVEYLFHQHLFGTYFLIIAIITTFLEAVFLLTPVVEACVSHTSIIVRVWDWVLWLDDWKKGGLYFVLFAPACFSHPAEVELGIPAGGLLIITGVLYMCKTFHTKKDGEDASIEDNTTYDRFDGDPEDIDEEQHNPSTPGTMQGGYTISDQSEILDL